MDHQLEVRQCPNKPTTLLLQSTAVYLCETGKVCVSIHFLNVILIFLYGI